MSYNVKDRTYTCLLTSYTKPDKINKLQRVLREIGTRTVVGCIGIIRTNTYPVKSPFQHIHYKSRRGQGKMQVWVEVSKLEVFKDDDMNRANGQTNARLCQISDALPDG